MAFFAASCQQEMLDPAAQESTVTYTVELPGVQTKAGATDYKFGSGLNTDELIYEVWKTENGNETNLTGTNAVRLYQETVGLHVIDGVRKTTISLNLVQDQEYTILFWAQVKDADVYNTENLTKVQYKYNPAEANYDVNREDMAAFYAVDFVSDGDPKAKKVVLKRPFAQLNIATEITTEEYKITLDKAEVVVDNVPSAFNVATKTSYAEERTRFVFNNADVPQEPNKTITVNNHTYNYVAMNYMFATNGGQTATVKYSIDATLTSRKLNGEISGETTKATVTNDVQNVPLQENYRTNIVGNLITSTTDYEVVIDASWDDVNDPDLNGDGYLVEVWDKKYTQEPPMVNGAYEISLASELAWVAAVANGNIVATKSATIDPRFKNVTVKLIEDIDLAGALWNPIKDFDGTFDGNGKTIKNLTVKAEGMAPAALFAHAHRVKNLTVANADIKGHYKTAVIVANAMGGGIVIENCAVVNSTVEATPINKDEANNVGAIVGYLSAENDACVKNCVVKDVTIKAFRKVGTIAGVANCAAVVKDNVMDNVTIIADQTVPYVKNNYDGNAGPVVGWAAAEATVTGNTVGDNVVVKRYVDSIEELAYAVEDAQNGDTIYIKGEVTLPRFKNKALNFEGVHAGATILEPVSSHENDYWQGAELNFKNLNIVGSSYTGAANGYVKSVKETYTNCNFKNYYMFAGDNTILTECTFTNEGQYFWTGSADVITFEKCAFKGTERAIKVCTVGHTGIDRKVTFNECTFTASAGTKAAIEIDGTKGSSYVVNINKCTHAGFAAGKFTNDTLFNVEGAENVTVYVDGKKWDSTGIFVAEDGTKYYSNTTGLDIALEEAQAGDVINLLPGEFAPKSYKAGVKLIGTSAEEVKVNVEGKKFGLGGGDVYIENVTLKFANVNYTGFQHTGNEIYKNCVIEGQPFLYGNNVTFETCTFKQTSSDWYNVWTYGAQNVNFNACKFYSAGKSVLVYQESNTFESNVTLNNCELHASAPVEGKAAVEIDASLVKKYVVNINNSVADGFAEGSVSKNALWNIKKGETKAEVYVDEALVGGYKVDGENTYVTSTAGFTAALEAKATKIILSPGTYKGAFRPRVSTQFESAGAEKAVIAGRIDFDSYTAGSSLKNIKFAITDDSTVKNVFTGANYKYPSTVNIYGVAVSFEGCEFETSIAKGVCGINYGAHASGQMLTVNNCKFVGDFYAIRSRTLFSVTNSVFDIFTNQGTLAAVFTWGNGEAGTQGDSGANSVVFTGNTNVNGNKIYGVQLTSTTFNYCHINYNVQKNDNFFALSEAVNSACDFTGKAFADGSETF